MIEQGFRVVVGVNAPDETLPWEDVLSPARGCVYALLATSDSERGADLHSSGMPGSGMKPVGVSGPWFPRAAAKAAGTGGFSIGGMGRVSFASPFPEIASSLFAAAAGMSETGLRWGDRLWPVTGVGFETAPVSHRTGTVVWRTVTPVVLKAGHGTGRYAVPGDPGYEKLLTANVRRKAEALGLPQPADVEVVEAGKRRLFRTPKGVRVGACLTVRVEADPRLLDALWCWGLGMDNIAGFGWIEEAR